MGLRNERRHLAGTSDPPFTDLDGDCATGVTDLVILIILAWGETNPSAADLNDDGIVDADDLMLLVLEWG